MEDQSIFNSQPRGSIKEDFRQFIKETIEEVVVEGRVFDVQKRWLRRLGKTEGVDCNVLEQNMTDLIEVMEEWKQQKSKSGERMARMLGKDCYLTEQDIDGLLQKLEGGKPAAVSATNPTHDASMMGGSQSAEDEYISECIKEVCVKGDSLSKYRTIIEKKFGIEYYQKCEGFVEQMKRSVDKKKFTNTSVTNLHYLAHQIGVSDATVDAIVKHFTDKFEEEERQRQVKIVATDDTIKRIVLDEIHKYGLDGDLNHIDVSRVTNMKNLFDAEKDGIFKRFNCDISKWNVSKVRNMSDMFRGCESFNGDLSKWDVGSVEDMEGMFMYCKSFNCDLGGWDVSNVKNMGFVFTDCEVFNGDISGWDVSNVEAMGFMFEGCKKFNCDLSGWNVSSVRNMGCMFFSCEQFNCDISKWNVSNVVHKIGIFEKCPIREAYKPTFE